MYVMCVCVCVLSRFFHTYIVSHIELRAYLLRAAADSPQVQAHKVFFPNLKVCAAQQGKSHVTNSVSMCLHTSAQNQI